MTYEKFEHKAISVLLEGNDPVFERLFNQFLDAEVLKREETESGFVVEFKILDRLAVDKITRKISGVRVMLFKEELLDLELTVTEGLITHLKATYLSKTKYSNLLFQLNDLVFTPVLDRKLVEPKADFVEKNENFYDSTVKNENQSKKIELNQNIELTEKSEELLSENIKIKELIEQERIRILESVKKSEQQLASIQLRELIGQEQEQISEAVEQNLESIHLGDLISQEQGQASEAVEQRLEHLQLGDLISQEQGQVSEAVEQRLEHLQLGDLISQEQEQISEAVEQNLESIHLGDLISQEQGQASEAVEQRLEHLQLGDLISQEQGQVSEAVEQRLEHLQLGDLISQEQGQVSEAVEQRLESIHLGDFVNQEQGQVSEAVEQNLESIHLGDLISQEQGQASEAVEQRLEHLQLGDLISQEQGQTLESLEKISHLLDRVENIQINKLIKQEQTNGLPKSGNLESRTKEENIALDEYLQEKVRAKQKLESEVSSVENQKTDELADKKSKSLNEKLDENANKKTVKKSNDWKYRSKKLDKKNNKKAWNYLTLGIDVLFYLSFIISFVVILLLGFQNISNEIPNVMGFSVLRVVSVGMEDDFLVDTLVIIRKDEPNNLVAGQMIVYVPEDGSLMLYSIYDIEKDDYGNNYAVILGSDNSTYLNNQSIPIENVLGHVVFASHTFANVLLFFEERLIILVGLTMFLGFFSNKMDRKR